MERMATDVRQTIAAVSDVVVESAMIILSRWMVVGVQGAVHDEHWSLIGTKSF
jgi:hypothetical protein